MPYELKDIINTVICDDCLNVLKDLPNKCIDLCLCDPPYGIGIDKLQNGRGGKKGFGKNAGTYKKYHEQDWDSKIPDNKYFNEIKRISKNWIIFGGNYFPYLDDTGVIIWNKGSSGNFKEGELAKTNINTFKIFYLSRADAYINQLDSDEKLHPTQKPIKLFKWILQNYSKETDLILDPFLGSGTTAVACQVLKRNFIGIEISEKYCEMARDRLKQQILL